MGFGGELRRTLETDSAVSAKERLADESEGDRQRAQNELGIQAEDAIPEPREFAVARGIRAFAPEARPSSPRCFLVVAEPMRPALLVLFGAVACGAVHIDDSVTTDSGPDAPADVVDDAASADSDAQPEADSHTSDGNETDAPATCTDAGLPVAKKWRVSCCNGSICQGTCLSGQCVCGSVAGGCEHLRCCDVGGASGEKLVCGGEGVCWPYQ